MTYDPLEVSLEHVFDIRVDFTANRCIFGPLPGGHSQGYTPTSGGRIYGPRLNGRVVPDSGADFAAVRPDGVIEINSHYLLETDDGTKIYICNRGYLVSAKPGEAQLSHGTPQPAYFRFTPTFKVPAGPHDWLARTVLLGAGERRSDPDHSIFRYYIAR
jgi:hypothetical protein